MVRPLRRALGRDLPFVLVDPADVIPVVHLNSNRGQMSGQGNIYALVACAPAVRRETFIAEPIANCSASHFKGMVVFCRTYLAKRTLRGSLFGN